MPRLDTKFLLIRLGHFARQATATANGSQRSVNSKECVVLDHVGLDLKGFGHHIELTVFEKVDQKPLWDNDVEKLGAFAADNEQFRSRIGFYVPSVTFEAIWAGAASADGSMKNLQIEYHLPDDKQYATIYGATYYEDFPYDHGAKPLQYPSKEFVKPRIHPVVVELRSWNAGLNSLVKGVGVLFFVWLALFYGSQIPSWLRHLSN